jgi:Sec-independent protein translocase protein TatA
MFGLGMPELIIILVIIVIIFGAGNFRKSAAASARVSATSRMPPGTKRNPKPSMKKKRKATASKTWTVRPPGS